MNETNYNSMQASLRIAHLSDVHFSKVSFHPDQFKSKRWIGNLNLFLFRNSYQQEHLNHVPELLETLITDVAFITGDFSSTSLEEEFQRAKKFVEAFPMPVFVLPGNHDCYTKEAEKKRVFYDHFPSSALKKERVEKAFLKNDWWWIGLDCAVATPPFCANGFFSEKIEKKLQEALDTIPEGHKVILGNHFPLFPAGRPKHDLIRVLDLQKMLKANPKVKLYLHGHDHKPYIIDKVNESFPLTVNAGSCAHRPRGTFYIIDLYETECLVQQLFFRKEKEEEQFSWVIQWQKKYSLRS